MVIELGADPTVLIALSFLEIFLVVIPALIASKVEASSFKTEISEIGFNKTDDTFLHNLLKVIFGLNIGILLYLVSGFVMFFFRNVIVENLFGATFVEEGRENAISTKPIDPDMFQITFLIIIQFIIIGPCEEGLFRGFILKKCEKKMKKKYAIVISSIFFSLYHAPPIIVPLSTIITFFGYYFTFGIIIGLIYINSENSLIPCSIGHSFFNVLVLLI